MPKSKKNKDPLAAAVGAGAESAAGAISSKPALSAAGEKEVVTNGLPKDIAGLVASYASDDANLRTYIRGTPSFFPHATSITELLYAVVMGEPEHVLAIISKNPQILFEKGRVTTACRHVLTQVSPYQAIQFYFDGDMAKQVQPFVLSSEACRKKAQEQSLEMKGGGADLVKMTAVPTSKDFISVTRFIEGKAIYSLLENKDGIVFCTTSETLYYANQENQTIIELKNLEANQNPFDEKPSPFDELKTIFDEMEENSSRRSNNNEHALIQRLTKGHLSPDGIHLERGGIHYERDGIHFQDTRMEVRSVNAYRRFLRLVDIHQEGTHWNDVGDAWIAKGLVLREIIHILQRFCEEDKPFYPLEARDSLKSREFNRSLQFENFFKNRYGSIDCLLPFHDLTGLGVDFSLYKDCFSGRYHRGAAGAGRFGWPEGIAVDIDLAAVCQIIEVGKAIIAELVQELNPAPSAAAGDHSGPGCIVS